MEVKNFNDITVKDITDKADLNRGTFYLHYSDTYDLLEKVENEILGNIQLMIDEYLKKTHKEKETVIPAIYPIALYILENADICRCLINNKASSDFIDKFRDLILKNEIDIINKKYPKIPKGAYDYYLSFITYGIIGILKTWLSQNPISPVEEVAEWADKIVSAADTVLRA